MLGKYIVKTNDNIAEVSKPNSSTVVIRAPFNKMADAVNYVKNNCAIYILYRHNDFSKDEIYIGKVNNAKEFDSILYSCNKDTWDQCYILTQHKENSFFNDTITKYIKDELYRQIYNLNRFDIAKVVNNQVDINEFERHDCDTYLNDIYNMLYAIGLDFITVKNNLEQTKTEDNSAESNIFFIKMTKRDGDEVNARLVIRDDKFVVLQGSKIASNYSEANITTKNIVSHYWREITIENNVTKMDLAFDSPSAAAMFVLGRTSNGRTEWKNNEGYTLEETIG